MDSPVQLGQFLYGNPKLYNRDAVHVAIAPVVSAYNGDMAPGTQLEFASPGNSELVVPYVYATYAAKGKYNVKPVGIVDPFLYSNVYKGARFYMFLMPNTVRGIRHLWTHDAFDLADAGGDPVVWAEGWITEFAESIEQTYDALMNAADTWVASGEYTYDNSEEYKNAAQDPGIRFGAIMNVHVKLQCLTTRKNQDSSPVAVKPN